jgi:hypothetical protein
MELLLTGTYINFHPPNPMPTRAADKTAASRINLLNESVGLLLNTEALVRVLALDIEGAISDSILVLT